MGGGADATEVELKALKNDEAEGNWTHEASSGEFEWLYLWASPFGDCYFLTCLQKYFCKTEGISKSSGESH